MLHDFASRRASIRHLAAWLAVGILAALAVSCSPLTPTVTASGAVDVAGETRIWDVHAGRFVSEADVVAQLVSIRFRLLGEVHDNPLHHEIRARLLRAIAASGRRPGVVMEQFDLDNDALLIAAQSSGADAEQVAQAGRLDRKAWLWPLHKPIIQAALEMHLPIRAGNLARTSLRAGAETAAWDDAGIGSARLHAARWTQAQASLLQQDIESSHCGRLPPALVPRIVLAQRMRDAAMAQALVNAATSDGAILIAGDGHVRSDLGVPVYLHAGKLPEADSGSLSVGFIDVSPENETATDFPRAVVARNPGFDYVWLTPSPVREDPCERMPALKAT